MLILEDPLSSKRGYLIKAIVVGKLNIAKVSKRGLSNKGNSSRKVKHY